MNDVHLNDFMVILRIISNILRMYGYVFILPVIVSLIYKEYEFTVIFLILFILVVSIFTLLLKLMPEPKCKEKHAILAMMIGWILVAFVSAIPFLFLKLGVVDSLFESISGLTTSGYTMIEYPENIPYTLNFFRGLTQWVGGFGIVILALLFYEKPNTAQMLFLAEGRFEDFYIDLLHVARIVVNIYVCYTIAGTALLALFGMSIFDALIHTMTSLSTGGFSTNAIGIGAYGLSAIMIGILLMLIGSMSFLCHYALFKKNFRKCFTNIEFKFLIILVIIGCALVCGDMLLLRKGNLHEGVFYVVSALSTTGAGSKFMVPAFPPISILVLVILMIFGGAYGSTAGGLKLWRVIILGKVIMREIKRPFKPVNSVLTIKMGKHIIDDETALRVTTFTIVYIGILLLGSLSFMLSGYSIVESVFTIASSQGNVGLNIITNNYYNMHFLLKLQIAFHMLIGRVEIFPMLMLLKAIFPRR